MTHKKINGYTIFMKQILGKGSYGSVYKGEQDGTKKECAIKILEKKLIDSDQYLKAALFSEIQILQMVKSENIVGVYDVMESNHNYYIIQELCDGDLEKLLKKQQKLSEERCIEILKQICNGFLSLVREGIVHRDLKPANILMCKGIAKIGDFGFAKKNTTKRMKNVSAVGTPLYMSLQILTSEPYTSKCDVWGTGFIFYEMLHGKTPWTANTEFQLVKNIQNKPLVVNQMLKAYTQDFLKKSLQIYEKDRMSWDQVFMHPIFDKYFHKYSEDNEKFQNKLKMVMTDLRFKINSQNIDLNKLLVGLGFSQNHDMNYKEFYQFLRHINPKITKDEVAFFFEKLDRNQDGSISVAEVKSEMEKNYINVSKSVAEGLEAITGLGSIKKFQTMDLESFQNKKMSSQLEIKVKKCFIKLYKILTLKKLTLYKTFLAYDSDKSGELTIDQFSKIMKRLDNSFESDEIEAIFEFIDTDRSKTIEFDEFNSYYCKVNGIPEILDMPPEFYSQTGDQNHKKLMTKGSLGF